MSASHRTVRELKANQSRFLKREQERVDNLADVFDKPFGDWSSPYPSRAAEGAMVPRRYAGDQAWRSGEAAAAGLFLSEREV